MIIDGGRHRQTKRPCQEDAIAAKNREIGATNRDPAVASEPANSHVNPHNSRQVGLEHDTIGIAAAQDVQSLDTVATRVFVNGHYGEQRRAGEQDNGVKQPG